MPRLTEIQSAQIVALLEAGLSQSDISRRMGIHRSTVSRVFSRYEETGSYRRRPGQGRHRITTNREDRNIVNETLRNPRQVARQIRNNALPDRPISAQTIRRRLHERGLRSRIRARVPNLEAVHRRARLNYARNYRHWTPREWRHVFFTDESRFCLYGNDARIRIWRRRRQRFAQNHVDPTRAFGGGSVMVWGGISMNHRSDLVIIPPPGLTAGRYLNEVLRPHVIPMRRQMGRNFILMQDNARPHTARITRTYLEENNVEVLPHPANSPDLNPIEHVWDMMGRRLRNLERPPANLQQLERILNEIWHEIPQDSIRACINMQERLAEVIRQRGGNTRY